MYAKPFINFFCTCSRATCARNKLIQTNPRWIRYTIHCSFPLCFILIIIPSPHSPGMREAKKLKAVSQQKQERAPFFDWEQHVKSIKNKKIKRRLHRQSLETVLLTHSKSFVWKSSPDAVDWNTLNWNEPTGLSFKGIQFNANQLTVLLPPNAFESVEPFCCFKFHFYVFVGLLLFITCLQTVLFLNDYLLCLLLLSY